MRHNLGDGDLQCPGHQFVIFAGATTLHAYTQAVDMSRAGAILMVSGHVILCIDNDAVGCRSAGRMDMYAH